MKKIDEYPEMKLYFFKTEPYNGLSFHNINIVAYQEYEGYDIHSNLEKKYKRIEHIDIHINKNPENYECYKATVEYGKDSCIGHSATNTKDFIKSETGSSSYYFSTQIDKKEYLELRAKAFKAIDTQRCVDFDTIKMKQDFNSRTII